MRRKTIFTSLVALFLTAAMTTSLFARANPDLDRQRDQTMYSTAAPAYGLVGHRIGRLVLAVNNNGTIGTGFAAGPAIDWFTGQSVPTCEYPKSSNVSYLFAGALWIGAVVGRDTMVSVAADGWSFVREFAPDAPPFGEIRRRSIRDPNSPLYEGAVSEEDYIMVYSDTLTENVGLDAFGRPHIPLNIEVTQRSYAWSYPYADDFILFDYSVRNIGHDKLTNVYMGYYLDADVAFQGGTGSQGWIDDICGFTEWAPSTYGCGFIDTVNIAWICDNDGDPISNRYTDQSVTGIAGIRVVRTPADSLDVSFNWWISNTPSLDFGPRERSGAGRWKEEFRDLRTGGLGTPEGDFNKYYFLRNMEFDYDQAFTATIGSNDSLWLEPPPDHADDYADGFDTRYLLSFGPFDIRPGESLPISMAYVGGEDFHLIPDNINNLPNNPEEYYRNLGFEKFGENAVWASRVYDNPGVDTDGNGTFGKSRICCTDSITVVDTIIEGDPPETTYVDRVEYTVCDTVWYEGDGVPDFRGASPPPPPDFWLEPSVGKIRVRFNGLRSETTKDVFARMADFEGYRIYLARDERAASYALIASYDVEDFNKFFWNEDLRPDPGYELDGIPLSLDTLRWLYAESSEDTTWHPLDFSRNFPFIYHGPTGDSLFYFEPQDYNTSEFGVSSPIRKIYPDQAYPSSLNLDSVDIEELTPDGYLKYFEYEFEINELLPSVAYWVNVTAFDFGSPDDGLQAMESSVTLGAQYTYPLLSAADAAALGQEVFVYPNPYRSNEAYRNKGFEGRVETDRPDDRVRAIHFANLPPKCTISIYTIDGDLVREIEHDKDLGDPTAAHDEWNLITRNTQLVVSGLYYWTIESADGSVQIGKLVIIM